MVQPRHIALAFILLAHCAPARSAAPVDTSVVPPPLASASAASTEARDAATPASPPAPVDRATLPCGDLAPPALQGIAPERTSAGAVRLARTTSGELFVTVTAHGSFAVPSHTATSSSSHTQLVSTWGFVERGGRFIEIGELGRGGKRQLAKGRGIPVLASEDGSLLVCKTGAHVIVPASPHARSSRLLALQVDGGVVVAVYADYGPRGPACKRLMSGSTLTRIHVDRVDVDAQTPTWSTTATRAVSVTSGPGCRGAFAAAADVAPGGESVAIAIQSCTFIDGGDYVSSSDCSMALDLWTAGRWATSKLATSFQRPALSVVVAVDKTAASVAVEDEDMAHLRVYGTEGATLVARGDIIEGAPMALSASRLVATDAKGTKLGENGAGYRFIVHASSGNAWASGSEPVEVTSVHEGSALVESSQVIVGSADTSAEAGPVVARIFRTEGRSWQPLATLDVHISM